MVAVKSHSVMEVHRILANPSEDITRKIAEAIGIETRSQWESCETCLQVKAKRYAVQKMTN